MTSFLEICMGSYINQIPLLSVNSLPLLCHTKTFFEAFLFALNLASILLSASLVKLLLQLRSGKQSRKTSLMELDEHVSFAIVVNSPSI